MHAARDCLHAAFGASGEKGQQNLSHDEFKATTVEYAPGPQVLPADNVVAPIALRIVATFREKSITHIHCLKHVVGISALSRRHFVLFFVVCRQTLSTRFRTRS